MSARRPAARRRLALALPLLAAGCGETPMGEALRGALAPPPAAAPAMAVAGPVLRVGGWRRPLTFTLLQQTAERRLWQAEGGLALATEGPRVTATAGFGRMLVATRFEGPDPLEDPRALLAAPAQARRSLDLQDATRAPESMRFGLLLTCQLAARPEGAALLVQEACAGDGLRFTNRFWADPATGAIHRSEQWVGEELPLLTLEMAGT